MLNAICLFIHIFLSFFRADGTQYQLPYAGLLTQLVDAADSSDSTVWAEWQSDIYSLSNYAMWREWLLLAAEVTALKG